MTFAGAPIGRFRVLIMITGLPSLVQETFGTRDVRQVYR